MVTLMSVAYYFAEVQRYEEEYKVYEGAFVNGFEYIMFVSCREIDEIAKSQEDRHATDINYHSIADFNKKYRQYFVSEYEPVYLKVRAAISKNEGNTWLGFSHALDVKEVIEILPYENRKCTPPYKPGFGEIKVEDERESPENVFKRLKNSMP